MLCFSVVLTAQKQDFKLLEYEKDSFTYRISETTDFVIKTVTGKEISREEKVVDYGFKSIKTKSAKKNTNQRFKITIKDIYLEKSDLTDTFQYHHKGSFGTNKRLENGYEQLINHQFNLVVTEKGKILTEDNFDNVYKKDFGTADIFDNADLDLIKKQIKAKFSKKTVEQTMRYFKYMYPIDSIDISDSWSVIDTLYPEFGVLSKMKYTLKEVKNNIAFIEVKSVLYQDENFKGLDMDMMYLKFDLKGQQEGLVLLDLKSGWIRKLTIAQNVNGRMTVFAVDPEGVNLKVQIKGTTEYDLINY
jgi:hypothetical protein